VVAAGLEQHPLEQAPGGGLPRAERVGVQPQLAQPLGQPVAHVFERTEVEQPSASTPGARRAPRVEMREPRAHGRAQLGVEPRDLPAQVAAGRGLVELGKADLRRDAQPVFALEHRHGQPPIGARGLAPQNSCVPSMPMRCTRTMLRTIDFAVARPTPTGPPPAW
jgi:hypothetical protein